MNRRRNQRIIALDHHLYDQLSNSWLNQSSKHQSYMKLGVDVLVDDYKHFGFGSLLTRPTRHADIMCMADTGCHSCLASIKAISRLGLKRQELIPVTMKMHAANKHSINILGLGKTSNGIRVSRQIVYSQMYITRCPSAERPAFRSASYLTNSLRLAGSPSIRPRMPHLTLLNTCAMTAVSPLIVAARNVNCHLHHQLSCHVLQLMVTAKRYDNSCWITTKDQPSTHANTNHSR